MEENRPGRLFSLKYCLYTPDLKEPKSAHQLWNLAVLALPCVVFFLNGSFLKFHTSEQPQNNAEKEPNIVQYFKTTH